VAHCNFQLRGKESDADEEFVTSHCHSLGIPSYAVRFDTEFYAWENGLSTQMAARELRYNWFATLMEERHYSRLATGHHFDDTIETILLNWTRGSSLDGLAGIPVRNKNIIRPMLFANRADVEKYAREKNIPWRDDQSNFTDDYQRNFVRHQIIPHLKELNPSLETTLHRGLEKIQCDLELVHRAVEEWRLRHVQEEGDQILIKKDGFDPFLQKADLLWRVIREYGFNFEQSREITQGLKGQSGKRFLSSSHQLIIDRSMLIITLHPVVWEDVWVAKDQQQVSLGPWKLDIRVSTEVKPGSGKLQAVLDVEKLTFPLRWRKWKPGDYFLPLGMEHKRKISDFLIDNKLSRADKDAVTVLESEGQVVWVVGYRIDNRYKITDTTRSVMVLTVAAHFAQ
jgi:tRNA(Ile)-lysidine synthase